MSVKGGTGATAPMRRRRATGDGRATKARPHRTDLDAVDGILHLNLFLRRHGLAGVALACLAAVSRILGGEVKEHGSRG